MKTLLHCEDCGAPLPADAPAGLCPQCLLKSEAKTIVGDSGPAEACTHKVTPVAGATFGAYKIVRLLGRGGMGEVYEAEQIESGRRVALKIMSQSLGSEQDRKRFLREGRLAASVNHPNVVYVHGSEEIEGVPVIAMELVQGGTLKDQLKRKGPLPVAEAVEAALQVIAGLDRAQAAGVLHRDIKPTNCFVDADGTVKVGDFGLSVSTFARGESLLTVTGSVIGTPAYASPEQLRGEELNVTSDIYSVGATLYHLLTGQTPFAAADFVKLITEVLDKQPVAPHLVRAEIPEELSKVVLRCLAKDGKARFPNYADLREALLPFRSLEMAPAKPAKRFLAGLLDDLIAYGPSMLFLIYWSFDPLDYFARERTVTAALIWIPFYLWYAGYYAVAEGLWGAGFGKSLCRLRVIGPNRQAPGIGRALLRVSIYMAPFVAPSLLYMLFVSQAEMRASLMGDAVIVTDWLWFPLYLGLFLTMRLRNGYAAVHDLFTGTRVVVRPKSEARPTLSDVMALADKELAPPLASTISFGGLPGSFGPYQCRQRLWKQGDEELLLGFDEALQRRVWVHLRRIDAAVVPSERRALSRPGRLRWLNAGRTESHVWDAYDAVDGAALLAFRDEAVSWSAVRFWLLDLAEELGKALEEQHHPELSLDRVWISSSGHLVLLDFAAPGVEPVAERLKLENAASIQRFMDRVATMALEGNRAAGRCAACLPLHAQGFLGSIRKAVFEKAEFILGNLHSIISKPAEITRSWRMASIGTLAAFVGGLVLAAGLLIDFERIRWERAWSNTFPGRETFRPAASLYVSTTEEPETAGTRDAELLRSYLAQNFRDLATNEMFWAHQDLSWTYGEHERGLLKQALGSSPVTDISTQEREKVATMIRERRLEERLEPLYVSGVFLAALMTFVVLIELAGALFFRQSPILRLFGIVVVSRSCDLAGRGRLLWRWTVVWVPVAVLGVVAIGGALIGVSAGSPLIPAEPDELPLLKFVSYFGALAASAVLLAGVIYSVLCPHCGLQDRLAGTRLVPQ